MTFRNEITFEGLIIIAILLVMLYIEGADFISKKKAGNI